MILVPAYGRDYNSAAEVRKDFEDGKDFRIADVSCQWNGCMTSIRDMQGHPDAEGKEFAWDPQGSYIRYKRKEELTHIGQWQEAEQYEEA